MKALTLRNFARGVLTVLSILLIFYGIDSWLASLQEIPGEEGAAITMILKHMGLVMVWLGVFGLIFVRPESGGVPPS